MSLFVSQGWCRAAGYDTDVAFSIACLSFLRTDTYTLQSSLRHSSSPVLPSAEHFLPFPRVLPLGVRVCWLPAHTAELQFRVVAFHQHDYSSENPWPSIRFRMGRPKEVFFAAVWLSSSQSTVLQALT